MYICSELLYISKQTTHKQIFACVAFHTIFCLSKKHWIQHWNTMKFGVSGFVCVAV